MSDWGFSRKGVGRVVIPLHDGKRGKTLARVATCRTEGETRMRQRGPPLWAACASPT